jgi:hypothetical protein
MSNFFYRLMMMKPNAARLFVALLFGGMLAVAAPAEVPPIVADQLQDVPEPVNMLAEDPAQTLELMSANGYWGRGEVVQVEGQPFEAAFQARAAQKPGEPHRVQLQADYQQPFARRDVMFIHFYARAVDVQQARMTVLAGPGSRHTLELGPEWTRVMYGFRVNAAAEIDDRGNRLTAFIGYEQQAIEVGGLVVLNFGDQLEPDQLPRAIPHPPVQMLRTGTEYTEPTPAAVSGAVIDETQVQVTLHLDAAAEPGGDGTEASPLQSLGQVLPLIREHLQAGEGVRVVLADGVYRDGWSQREQRDDWSIFAQRLGDAAVEPPVIIEAATDADVVFDGTDPFPLAQWEPAGQTADGAAIYRRPLPVELTWGTKHYGATNPNQAISYRPDLAFIGQTALRQVMLEQYPEIPRRGNGRVNWEEIYQGPLPIEQTLEPGTFGVVLHQADAQYIYICPPVDTPADAVVDVATRREALRFYGKDNVVVRGITFQRYAGNQNSSPLFIINSSSRMGHGLLVENCSFIWNNGTGLRYLWAADVTLRGNRFNYNGFRGEGGQFVRNILAENNEANFNNWRGYWGNFTGWAVAGSKSTHVRDMILRDYRTVGNLAYGYWLDVAVQNVNAQGILSAYNRSAGFYFEISDGPMQITDSILAYNGVGLQLQGSDQIQAHRNILVGNGQQLRMVHEREHGRNTSGGPSALDRYFGTNTQPRGNAALGRIEASNNLLVATEGESTQLISVRFDPNFPQRREHFFEHWLQMSDNTYARRGGAAFGALDLRHPHGRQLLAQRDTQATLEQWQDLTGQDSNSTMIDIDGLTWADEVPTTRALAEASPYLRRGISPELRAETEAFFEWAGVDFEEAMDRNIFLSEFEAEPGDGANQ